MQGILNPFNHYTGSDRIQSPIFVILLSFIVAIIGLIISKMGLIAVIVFIALPFIFLYLYILFSQPIVGLYTAISLGFLLLGFGRYVKDVPIGLAMDAILIITYIALIFKKFREKVDWTPAKKFITLLTALWFCYAMFELVNPEAKSAEAWFSGRGNGFYPLLFVTLTLLFIDTNRKLDLFFYLWGIFSLLVSFKGLIQLTIGLDPWEKVWLSTPGNMSTHMLFGKLRIFSILSDAGQFGANQAYSAVVASIISTVEKDRLKKYFFIAVAFFGFYGMIISGTRGAISIPLAGFMAFFVLRKNLTVMVSGFLLLFMVFVFFKFTNIGQSNPTIGRMRSGFDPNNPSLQVRLINQQRLKGYLASRPFGGGIGHAGDKAKRYLPYAFLSSVATDSWYVMIWAEQGIVGLSLHLFILFYTISIASFQAMFRIRDPILKIKMSALIAGMFGIMVASYANGVLGQMPTGMLIYTGMALMLNTNVFDTPDSNSVTKTVPLSLK